MMDYKIEGIEREVFFKTARSGGKGGQHVNKVETKVEAWWPVTQTSLLSNDEKERILQKLAHKINKAGYLVCVASDTRSQLENKLIAQKKTTTNCAKLNRTQKTKKHKAHKREYRKAIG